jgi:hypothetical protein
VQRPYKRVGLISLACGRGNHRKNGTVTDADGNSEKMAGLQKMRVALIILTSQETSKLLSARQRVAGKEIEVMTAERNIHQNGETSVARAQLDELYREDAILRHALREAEKEIEKMEGLMAKINADIFALCQS